MAAKLKVSNKRPKPRRVALTGSFLDKLSAWTAIVDEVVSASTAAGARKGCGKAEVLNHLPIDLFNDDECDERALNHAHASWNKKIETRIRSLGDRWDVVSEICKLRDLINDS